jgi:hypothetical protein
MANIKQMLQMIFILVSNVYDTQVEAYLVLGSGVHCLLMFL